MVSNQSFEIIVDEEQPKSPKQGDKPPKSSRKGLLLVLIGLGTFGLIAAALALSSDGEDTFDLGPSEQSSSFRPYVAEDVPEMPMDRGENAPESAQKEEVADGRYRPRMVEEGFQGENYWRDDPSISPTSQPIDGVRVLRDSRGNPTSRRETEERMVRQLDALQNSEHEFERRLRRREAILNSPFLTPDGPGGATVVPDMEINENLRRRINEEFRSRERPTSFLPEANHHEYGDGVTYPSMEVTWGEEEDVDDYEE